MKVDFFSFYKVQKNEDVTPFVWNGENEGLAIVADGLGGSGSFVHKLKDSDYNDSLAQRLKETFLPEYFSSENVTNDKAFSKWLDELVKPMADKEADTSALWGSRIVSARFIYYLKNNPGVNLNNEKDRKTIVDFIYKGMMNTVKKFQLEVGNIRGQLVLPTTLVVLKYKVVNEDVIVDVVWAGDSRAYAIIPSQGLKQLTKDDEDESKAINNLFAIEENKSYNTYLHFDTYKLPKESAIFACSDGIFDPYVPIDNIGVEAILLQALSEASDIKEFRKNWLSHYKPTKHDDCSVAFLAFGFKSFDEFKSKLIKRKNKLVSTVNDYFKYHKFIPLVKGEAENPENYIFNRAESRKKEIVAKIANELLTNPNSQDITITKEIRDIFTKCKKSKTEENEKKLQARKKEICEKIKFILNEDADDGKYIAFAKLFVDRRAKKENGAGINKIKYAYNALDDYKKANAKCAELEQKLTELARNLESLNNEDKNIKEKLTSLKARIKEEIAVYKKTIENFEKCVEIAKKNYGESQKKIQQPISFLKSVQSEITKAENLVEFLNNLLKCWNKKVEFKGEIQPYSNDKKLADDVKKIKKLIKDYTDIKIEIDKIESELEEEQKVRDKNLEEYKTHYGFLCKNYLSEFLDKPEGVIKKEAIALLKLPIKVAKVEIEVDDLTDAILQYFDKKKDAFNKIITTYISSTSPSVIDSIFNPNRLELCRTYKSIDVAKVKKLIKTIEELIKNSENILSILVC